MAGFNLGSFGGGLFQGVGSVMQLYGMYEGIQQMSTQMQGAAEAKEAMDQDRGLYQEGKHPQAQSMAYTADPNYQGSAPAVDTQKVADAPKGAEVNPNLVVNPPPALKGLAGGVDRHDDSNITGVPSAPGAPGATAGGEAGDYAPGGKKALATSDSPVTDWLRRTFSQGGASALPTAPAAAPGSQSQGIVPGAQATPSTPPVPTVAVNPPLGSTSPYGPGAAGSTYDPQAQKWRRAGEVDQEATGQTGAGPRPMPPAPGQPQPTANAPGESFGQTSDQPPPQATVQTPAQAQTGASALSYPSPATQPFRLGQPPMAQEPTAHPMTPAAQSQTGIRALQGPETYGPPASLAPTPEGLPMGPVSQAAPPPQSPMARLASALNPAPPAQAAAPEVPRQGIPTNLPAGPVPGTAPSEKAATPAEPPKPADAPPAQTQPGPVQVATTGKGATVAPGQTTPSVQSESQPQLIKPPLWTRPYMALREQRPDYADMVTRIADEHHVSPYRLAAHWWAESKLQSTSIVSSKGARGPMQIIDSTRKNVDPKGLYDPEKLEDALHLGALVIYGEDQRFGKDSMGSFLAYQGGEGSVNALATRGLEEFKQTHPQGYKYLVDNYPGVEIAQNMFTTAANSTSGDGAARLVAASNGGPDAVLREVVNSSPKGMGMTDMWRQAQTTLVYAAAMKGDYAGIQHAQDFIYQMSHQGALSNMAAAHQALMTGDVTSAAQYLAKAHAFFPDNTFGRFGIGSDGKLYGEQYSELTGKQIGKRALITADAVLYQMFDAHNPKEYVKQAQAQQKIVEEAAYHKETLAKDYAQIATTAQTAALGREQQERQSLRQSETQLEVAGMRSGDRAPAGQTQALHTIDVDTTKRYGPDNLAGVSPEDAAKLSPVYQNLRRHGVVRGKEVTDAQAHSLATRLNQGPAGGLQMRDASDGSTGVYEKGSETPIGYIDRNLANTIRGSQPVKSQQSALNVSTIGSQPQLAQQTAFA